MEVTAFYGREAQVTQFLRRHRIGLSTLVFTDIVGSTDLKRALGDQTAVSLIQAHHARLREVLAGFAEAEEIGAAGDSFFVVFSKPSDAVRFALSFQAALRRLARETGVPLKDRIGIHVGEVFIAEGGAGGRRKDLFGIQVDTCARITGLAGGDQILLTRFAFDNARQVLAGRELDGISLVLWLRHGLYQLKGVDEPLEVCEVGEQGQARLEPPLDSEKAKRCPDDRLKGAGWRPAAGQAVPRTDWVLQAKLGEGGFGEVWQAQQRDSGERCAFKFSFREDGRQLLEQAWKTYRRLDESGSGLRAVAAIAAAQLDEPPYFLRMEFVPGGDLAAWCAARGGPRQIPLGVRVEIVAQLAEALHCAHQQGVVHKDLKPSNILILGEGRTAADVQAKLTDFGVWSETQMRVGRSPRTTSLMGSPLYLSPEQARGERELGPASDVYALGTILYELLTGRPPFVRASFSEVLDAHRYEDPRLPSQEDPLVPDALQRICLKAMEKRRKHRYPSAKAMAEDLRRFTRGERVQVRPTQYDNLIASRVRRQVEQLTGWWREQLLTDGEFARLAGAYSGFDRAGLEAVMATRRVHVWLLLLLVGGWLLIDGCALWLKVQWDTLADWPKILIGWFPVLATNGLWAVFWRYGSYRAAHVMLLLGSFSLPAAVLVLLDVRHWLGVDLGQPSLELAPLHNQQVLAALLAAMLWTAWLGWRTRTVSLSALCAAFAAGAYLVILDFGGLRTLLDEHPATLALRALPLALLALGAGAGLGRISSRRRQAAPWFALALALGVLVPLTVASQGPQEWLYDRAADRWRLPEEAIKPLQGFLVAACAALYLPAGLLLRRRYLVAARAAYTALLGLAPICLLGGIEHVALAWPESWPAVTLFGVRTPQPDLWLGALSIGCVLLAARVQVRAYAIIGLVFLTLAEWRIGWRYVATHNPSWAVWMLGCGAALVAALALREVRCRRRQAREDMDDVAERLQSAPHAGAAPADGQHPEG